MAESLKYRFKKIRQRLDKNSCANLIWLINLLPNLAGFPYTSSKFKISFWIVHTVLMFYVYIVGTVVYQIYYANNFIDSINSFFNISIFILIFNDSWWLLSKSVSVLTYSVILIVFSGFRRALKELLVIAKKNDDLVRESGRCSATHMKLLRNIKIIVLMCYLFHAINDIMIFIPSRTISMNDFSVASCGGLEPLTQPPNRQICMVILAAQELTAIVAVGSYDVTLLFLFSHTTAIFQILSEDMKSFSKITRDYNRSKISTKVIKGRLENIILRHSLALHAVKNLEAIYNTTIGVGFGLDAASICLFFVLPLDACLGFAPLIYHGLFIFFLYCFQGQRLTTASQKFETEVYCCGWENLKVKEQKYVLLILRQAQKPVIVHAAAVVPILIYTFANTMQSIYKLVTIFKF